MIGSAACGSSSITVRPFGPAPASANTSIRSRARSREPAATRLRRSRARGRIACRAVPRRAARRARRRSARAGRRAQLRVAPAALAARSKRSPAARYDIAHSPHPLLLPVASAAQVVTIHDLHFLSHPERTSAEIRRDYPALVRAHARRADRIIVVSRFVAGEVQRAARQCRQIAFPSARTARPSGRRPPAARRCRRLPAVRRHDRAAQECRRAARRICAAARAARRRSAPRDRRSARS